MDRTVQSNSGNVLGHGVAAFNRLYGKYKREAKRRNLTFQLTKFQFRILTRLNCYYCGDKPANNTRRKDQRGDYIYNGIDRVNNNIGYVTGNVVACCKICNFMKGKLDQTLFLTKIKQIYENEYS